MWVCVGGGVSTHAALLNRVESKAIRLISSPPLTNCLPSFRLRRSVASLGIFYRYFHANCSFDIANCIPPLLQRPRYTRLSALDHPYNNQIVYARVNQYFHSFIPSIVKLWNSVPFSVFPPAYDLDAFKRGEPRHLLNSNLPFWISYLLLRKQRKSGLFFTFFMPNSCLLSCKNKKKERKKKKKKAAPCKADTALQSNFGSPFKAKNRRDTRCDSATTRISEIL